MAYQLDPKTVIRTGYGRGFNLGVFGSIFGHNVTQNLPVLGIQSVQPANNFDAVFTLDAGTDSRSIPRPFWPHSQKVPTASNMLPNGVTAFVIYEPDPLPHRGRLELQRPAATQRDIVS